MKYLGFLFSLLISLGLIFALNSSIKSGDKYLPPIGKFINPFTGFWQNAESAPNDQLIQLTSEELQAEVRIIFDDRKVPHIFAKNLHDALFAQGYVMALDRLWQMDFSTRAAAGRLSELSGSKMTNFDLNRRRIGMVWAAENAVEGWKEFEEEFNLLSSYINGINYYIDQLKPKDYPLEFKLINYKPEEWTALKSALFFKSMALTLCGWEEDLESTNMLEYFGDEIYDFLYPDFFNRQSPVIPKSVDWSYITQNSINENTITPTKAPRIGTRIMDEVPKNTGSNNWAVSGAKSKTGKPILCNDPHLMLSLPSIWHEMHMVTPDMNVYGVCLPGMPGVIIGFNEYIAWGATNVGHDLMDWVQIQWADENKTKYFLDGQILDVKYRYDTLRVRRGEDIIDTVKYTYWGPVSFENSAQGYQDMALRWIAHDKPDSPELSVFVKLNTAKSFDDYDQITKDYISPAQNFVFASKTGDIALKVNGRFPIKSKGEGKFVKDGSTSDNDWNTYIPMEHVPMVKNPQRQFVSSANQHSTDETYPYYYMGNFEAYRGRILNEKLEGMSQIDIRDMQALQTDAYSLKAREILPILIELVEDEKLDKQQQAYVDMLKSWNYRYDRNSEEATLFNEWFREFYKYTWDEFYALRDSMLVKYPDSWRTVQLLEDNREDPFFDKSLTPEIETARDIALESFHAASEKIQQYKSKNGDASWGHYRKFSIRHLANIPAFSASDLSVDGHGDVLNANSGSQHGPSWRMIVSLTDPVEAYGVFPGGQSGNPGSPFYKTGLQQWLNGEYFKLQYVKRPEELDSTAIFEIQLDKQ